MFKTPLKGELTVVISEKNIKDKPFKEDDVKKKSKIVFKNL